MVIPKGVSWTSNDGPSMKLKMTSRLDMIINPIDFIHCLVMGSPGSGKGVFCSSFGLYARDNFQWKFLDFFDENAVYENGCYGWPQDDNIMLDRLEDTFPLIAPTGYPFEMMVPQGCIKRMPDFFREFAIGYHNIEASDFNDFYSRGSGDDDLKFQTALATSESIDDFLEAVRKHVPAAFPVANSLVQWGTIGDTTTLDYKRLADWKYIHSFSMAAIIDRRCRAFLNNLVVRLIYEDRTGKSYNPCTFYVREAGGMDNVAAKLITTRGRHNGVHFLADTQRRVGMMDKTVGLQFASQAFFRMTGEQAVESLKTAGAPLRYAQTIASCTPGVCVLNFAGSNCAGPIAIAPPASKYKMPGIEYFKLCKSMGAKFVTSKHYIDDEKN
jgi:hypothetical protein